MLTILLGFLVLVSAQCLHLAEFRPVDNNSKHYLRKRAGSGASSPYTHISPPYFSLPSSTSDIFQVNDDEINTEDCQTLMSLRDTSDIHSDERELNMIMAEFSRTNANVLNKGEYVYLRNPDRKIFKFRSADKAKAGAQGKVYIGYYLQGKTKVAIKESQLETRTNLQPSNIERTIRRVGIRKALLFVVKAKLRPKKAPEYQLKLFKNPSLSGFYADVANEYQKSLISGLFSYRVIYDHNTAYMPMEFFDGKLLIEAMTDEDGPFSKFSLDDMFNACMNALYRLPVAHNDFGGNNVMLGLEAAERGELQAKIIDFGASSSTQSTSADILYFKKYFIDRIKPKSLPKFRRDEYRTILKRWKKQS